MEVGEVRQLGRHRLMCGDAFNAEHVDALLGDVRPDMLYCDPPYGIALDTNYKAFHGKVSKSGKGVAPTAFVSGEGAKRYAPVGGDEVDFDPQPLLGRFSDVGEQFWWGADHYRERIPANGSWIVWDKRITEVYDDVYGSHFELCWSKTAHQAQIARVLWCGFSVHKASKGVDYRRVHPTQKPVALGTWFLTQFSSIGDRVCDLFAGSGSTLLACERMGRDSFSMEIEPTYCDVIIDRYTEMAKQPRLMEAM